MRALFLLAALTATSSVFAASPTPPTPPVAPSAPAVAFEKAEKATPPLRLRDPVMFDGRRKLAPGGFGPSKSVPAPRSGPGIG